MSRVGKSLGMQTPDSKGVFCHRVEAEASCLSVPAVVEHLVEER